RTLAGTSIGWLDSSDRGMWARLRRWKPPPRSSSENYPRSVTRSSDNGIWHKGTTSRISWPSFPGQSAPSESSCLAPTTTPSPQLPAPTITHRPLPSSSKVARMLRNCRPKRTIRFVAFACEEPPHYFTHEMGSQVYSRQCRARGEQIVGMLCLEMVGYFVSAKGSQRVPDAIPRFLHWAFPRRGNFLAAVGNMPSWKLCWKFRRGFKFATRFPLFSICLPELVHDIRRSDNSSFWDQGYSALMLTDTSYLRNPHYHLASDTPDTLDYESMAGLTSGVAGALALLAGVRQVS